MLPHVTVAIRADRDRSGKMPVHKAQSAVLLCSSTKNCSKSFSVSVGLFSLFCFSVFKGSFQCQYMHCINRHLPLSRISLCHIHTCFQLIHSCYVIVLFFSMSFIFPKNFNTNKLLNRTTSTFSKIQNTLVLCSCDSIE